MPPFGRQRGTPADPVVQNFAVASTVIGNRDVPVGMCHGAAPHSSVNAISGVCPGFVSAMAHFGAHPFDRSIALPVLFTTTSVACNLPPDATVVWSTSIADDSMPAFAMLTVTTEPRATFVAGGGSCDVTVSFIPRPVAPPVASARKPAA